uniref:Fibronectin type III domain-containing protein n=1 Tax=Candidatus Kentrum sp. FM TaxID=2126340 RepID=A0A450S9H1_9GAMM|nr:MAG: Fibronectin type III domain-containing protein [Candidatus Kentron sp. FM]VFJ48983.1 MAG: Fibronectin type III domain-containing protein [Candidatus Kentron sp. FM]VFK14646.1 MAG: Fibronectin type III domain-containing protein [Candidatus Kentron sp. FM]
MPSKFPGSERKFLSLAREMAAGFAANPGTYPAPPVNAADMEIMITSFVDANEGVANARAQVSQAQENKEGVRETLRSAMKRNIRYAENTVNYDDGQLQLIGWSGRRPSETPQPPGRALDLVSPDRGDGWIELTWEAPGEGGKVTAYQVMRRVLGEERWTLAAMSLEPAARLENQESGKKFEFCVVAVNKAGDGPESNVVTAGL